MGESDGHLRQLKCLQTSKELLHLFSAAYCVFTKKVLSV